MPLSPYLHAMFFLLYFFFFKYGPTHTLLNYTNLPFTALVSLNFQNLLRFCTWTAHKTRRIYVEVRFLLDLFTPDVWKWDHYRVASQSKDSNWWIFHPYWNFSSLHTDAHCFITLFWSVKVPAWKDWTYFVRLVICKMSVFMLNILQLSYTGNCKIFNINTKRVQQKKETVHLYGSWLLLQLKKMLKRSAEIENTRVFL